LTLPAVFLTADLALPVVLFAASASTSRKGDGAY
jgi:hypothetical protein